MNSKGKRRGHYYIKTFETFYVFEGSADFRVGDELYHANKGSCVHIPPGVPHQVTSRGRAHAHDLQSGGYRGNVRRHACAHPGSIDGRELTRRIALEHDTVMIEKNQKAVAARA